MHRTGVSIALIVAAVAAVYGVTLTYGFVWDDGFLILENRYLDDWSELGNNLTSDFFRKTREVVRIGFWRPLITLSYMIDRTLFEDRPWGFHLANVLMHALASCLVFVLARRLELADPVPLTAGLLFAVHPVHVESVAWVSGRTDVYCAVFVLAAVILDFDNARAPDRIKRGLSIVATALALLSKEMALVVPALIALRPALFPTAQEVDRGRLRSAFHAAWPHALMVAAYAVVRLWILGVAVVPGAAGIRRSVLFWTWWDAMADYLRLLVWPRVLSVTPEITSQSSLSAVGFLGLVCAAGMIAAIWRMRRSRPTAAYAIAFLLVSLVPLTNFVLPINAPTTYPFAERYLYLPSVAFCIAAAWLALRALPRLRPSDDRPAGWAVVVAVSLVIAFGARAAVRVGDWRDDLQLFESAVRLTPGESKAHVNYGVALADRGDPDAAEVQFQEVLSFDPGNAKAHYNLGNIYRERGDLVAAEAAYLAALRTKPTHAQSHLNLGLVFVATGRTRMALDAFTRADDVLPDHVDAKINRGNALRLLDRGEEAIAFLRDAVELEPDSWAARLGLAQAELETGRYDQGLERLRGLVADEPDLVQARLSMAIELDRRGAYELAEAAFLEVLRLDPDNTKVMIRLGLAIPEKNQD